MYDPRNTHRRSISRMNGSKFRVTFLAHLLPIATLVIAMSCTLFIRIGIFSWHDTHRIYQWGALIGTLVLLTSSQVRATVMHLVSHIKSAFWGLGIVLALGFVSASLADQPIWALQEVLLYSLAVLLMFIVAGARIVIGSTLDKWLLWFVGGLIGLYVWYVGLPLGIELFSGRGVRATHLMQGFDNPRFLGQFQTLTLPLLAALAVGAAGGSRLPLLWLGLMAFWWMLSFATGTRATWLAMGMASLLALGFGRASWRIMASLAITALIGFVLYWLVFVANSSLPGSAPDTGLLARLDHFAGLSSRDLLWGRAWLMWIENPWFGVGPMHFAAYHTDIGMHPHNVVLQWLAEWGTLAALIMLGLIAWGQIRFFFWARRQQSALAIALWMSLLAAMIQALVDGVFVMPNTQMWLILIAGWALGMYYQQQVAVPTDTTTRHSSLWLGVLAAACYVAYAWLLIPQIQNIEKRELAHIQKYPELMKPRFWRQGYIGGYTSGQEYGSTRPNPGHAL